MFHLRMSLWLIFSVSFVFSEEVKFIKDPSVVKKDHQYVVSFAVNQTTDVTVSVKSQKGKIVRHLAAGLIGENISSPSPLQKGLQQEIIWDGKDDFGKVLEKAEYSLTVSIGGKILFSNYIGHDPYLFGSLHSMAIDEDQNIYLMSYQGGYNQNMDTLRVFTKEGKYLKTLIPFSESLPKEKMTSVADWNDERKTFMPKNKRSQLPEFYPWGAKAYLVSASKNGIVLTANNQIYQMNADGSDVRGPFPLWNKDAKLKNPKWNTPQMAVSPDGKYMYIANVAGTRYQPKGVNDFDAEWPQGRIYRKNLTQENSNPEQFYDLELPDYEKESYWLPDAWNKRTAAYNVSVDSKGHVYVCDLVNQAIVEVSPEGKKVSSTKVPWPEQVHINEKGDYYVLSRAKKPLDGYVHKILHKMEGRGEEGKITATLSLEKWKSLGQFSLLSSDKGKDIIWVGGGSHFLSLTPEKDTFIELESLFKQNENSQQDWNRLATDYDRDEIYASNGTNLIYRYQGKDGKGELLKKDGKVFHGVDIAVAYDGSLYIRTGESYSGPLERFNYALEPQAFETGTNSLSKFIYSRYGVGNCEKGMGVGPNGECYINYMYGWNQYFLAGFDGKGNVMRGKYLKGEIKSDAEKGAPAELDSAIIGPIPAACGGVKVDLQGNIYVGMRLVPEDFKAATGYEKNIAFNTWTGCIAKFSSAGGTVVNMKSEIDGLLTKQKEKIAGALKVYPGVAPFSGGGYGGGGSSCVCRVPRFDVDRYGRICYTNAVTNSAVVVDNEGNLLYEFGQYGNFDAQLDASQKSDATFVPLAWPIGAGFTQNHIYVMDLYNRRIVKTNYQFALIKKISVKVE